VNRGTIHSNDCLFILVTPLCPHSLPFPSRNFALARTSPFSTLSVASLETLLAAGCLAVVCKCDCIIIMCYSAQLSELLTHVVLGMVGFVWCLPLPDLFLIPLSIDTSRAMLFKNVSVVAQNHGDVWRLISRIMSQLTTCRCDAFVNSHFVLCIRSCSYSSLSA